ncbi:MAG: hypothetical protein ACREUD_03685 [Gammaproteobacteria bacterium]
MDMRILGVRTLACSVVVSSLFASGALAHNFYELSGKTGCDSVMESRRSECNDLNAKKDRACQMQGRCDLDKHIAQIAEYKAAVERLNSGQIAEADRDSFKASIEKMKAELDARKNDAEANERAARECADARQAVYDFFGDDVIPDTESAARQANDRREDLLEEIDKAEVLQQAAKDKRDGLAGADPETDRTRWDEYVKMRDEYEKNAAAYRETEARLTEFNRTHGDDIDRYVGRLVAYYGSEQVGHKTAIEEQKNRTENCGKLEYMSY